MATRTYKSAADYDAQQSHWTIETVESRYYLRMGALNRADQRFVESLIADGYVGFFQNDVRVAIAGVSSAYDAVNDRIEIDREVTELILESEYEILFTQARPGRDGEGAVPTPGRDGERGSLWTSGDAFPEFPNANDHHLFRSDVTTGLTWFDTDRTSALTRAEAADIAEFNGADWVKKLNIRGIPGIQGIQGNPGEDANDGWSPVFSVLADGERRVLQVSDWVGGTGTKPTTGQYVGTSGLVDNIENGVDIRGPRGIQGNPGEDADDGWSPVFSVLADGERRVLQVSDWVGGTGTKPTTGQYVGISGLVDDIENGVDIRGPRGLQGFPGIPGRDSVGDVQFSYGFFTPTAVSLFWRRRGNQNPWLSGGPDANHISISDASGRWTRIDNIVHYFACFKFVVNQTNYSDGITRLTAYFNPPVGTLISGGHGVGTPMGVNAPDNWFPVTVGAGDRFSSISDGVVVEGGNINSLRFELADPTGNGNHFNALISITGMYTVES